MSETSASGGAAAPGWYTDPHDPNQLRWWSGEGWTDHVSGGAAPEAAAEPAAQEAAAQQPAVQQAVTEQPSSVEPVAQQPAAELPTYAEPVAQQPVAEQAFAPQQAAYPPVEPQVGVASAVDPLPSRRALRDPATESYGSEAEAAAASEAAEAAIRTQQAAQADQQAQAAQQQQQPAQQPAAQQQAVQPNYVPPVVPAEVAPAQPSAPVPTLPVQQQSFLEQAGYPPLDAPTDPQAGPAAPVAPQAPAQDLPPQALPAQTLPPQTLPPQQPAQMPQAPHQVQPLDANAWDQAAAAAGPFSELAPVQNQWTQPVVPETQAPPAQQGWGAPGTAAPTAPATGMDALFGGAQPVAPTAPTADPAAAGWGLTPSAAAPAAGVAADDAEYGSRRRGAVEAAAPATAGSSTFWGWLIAISPILAAGAIGYVVASTGYVTSGWPLQAAVAAPYLLVLLFALADRAGLLALGHTSPRSPAWALLTAPVYLIVRASETRREDGTGTALTLVWFVSFLVGLGGFIGYGFLTHHALIPGLPI